MIDCGGQMSSFQCENKNWDGKFEWWLAERDHVIGNKMEKSNRIKYLVWQNFDPFLVWEISSLEMIAWGYTHEQMAVPNKENTGSNWNIQIKSIFIASFCYVNKSDDQWF